MTQQYEIAVLYDPGLEIDLEKATSRVEKIFTDNGGEVTNVDNWGKRKLAYNIKGNESAIYVFYALNIPAENVQRIEKTLNITDEVIRFLITRPDFKAIAKADAAKALKAEQAAKRAERDGGSESKDEE